MNYCTRMYLQLLSLLENEPDGDAKLKPMQRNRRMWELVDYVGPQNGVRWEVADHTEVGDGRLTP